MEPARDVISFAKLRASYGANGVLVSSIGNYTVQGAYGSTTKYNGGTANYLSTLPNAGLVWEKSWTAEGGLDISFFQNRLNLNLTAPHKVLLYKVVKVFFGLCFFFYENVLTVFKRFVYFFAVSDT